MGSGPLFNSIQEKIIAFRQQEQNLWSITFQNSNLCLNILTFSLRTTVQDQWMYSYLEIKTNWNLKLGSQISCPA